MELHRPFVVFATIGRIASVIVVLVMMEASMDIWASIQHPVEWSGKWWFKLTVFIAVWQLGALASWVLKKI